MPGRRKSRTSNDKVTKDDVKSYSKAKKKNSELLDKRKELSNDIKKNNMKAKLYSNSDHPWAPDQEERAEKLRNLEKTDFMSQQKYIDETKKIKNKENEIKKIDKKMSNKKSK